MRNRRATDRLVRTISPIVTARAEAVAESRAADLEIINEWRGVYRHADPGIVAYVIDKLGIEGALTPTALALMADEYRHMERRHDATRRHNEAIYARAAE